VTKVILMSYSERESKTEFEEEVARGETESGAPYMTYRSGISSTMTYLIFSEIPGTGKGTYSIGMVPTHFWEEPNTSGRRELTLVSSWHFESCISWHVRNATRHLEIVPRRK
jgi:hypothetical protein